MNKFAKICRELSLFRHLGHYEEKQITTCLCLRVWRTRIAFVYIIRKNSYDLGWVGDYE